MFTQIKTYIKLVDKGRVARPLSDVGLLRKELPPQELSFYPTRIKYFCNFNN